MNISLEHMIKYFLVLTLASINFISCNKQEEQKNLHKGNTSSVIKSCIENEYDTIKKLGKIEKGDKEKKTEYNYNDKGFVETSNEYYPNGELFSKSTYKYNHKNHLTEKSSYASDGNLFKKNIYQYDEKGILVENKEYSADGKLINRYTYQYDNQGNLSEEYYYSYDGELTGKSVYKYDDKKNKIEHSYYANQQLEWKESYKYTFDDKGNWIQKITLDEDGEASSITERTIEYY